ncbi:MAG: hypothetical protein FWE09_02955 [Treponema sp.]|nr:hypothetical protein [Treponema sp.]
MIKEELIRRSPIRLFEKSIRGGLRPGEMGIVASQRGVGKTSVLVQIALDRLLQGGKVIHVSFAQASQKVFGWYQDIFEEFAGGQNLVGKEGVKDDIMKNRVLMNFNQSGMTLDTIAKSLGALIRDGGFSADALIVDGFDFSLASRDYVQRLKAFAAETGLSIWCNCTVNGGADGAEAPRYDEERMPVAVKGFADLIDVAVVLEPASDCVELSVSKARGEPVAALPTARLDPRTLLILES